MKRTKIKITQSLKDQQIIPPQILITFENQVPTHKDIHHHPRTCSIQPKCAKQFTKKLKTAQLSVPQQSAHNLKSPTSSISRSEKMSVSEKDALLKTSSKRFSSFEFQKFMFDEMLDVKKNKLLETLKQMKDTSKLHHQKGPSIFENTNYLTNVLKQQRKKNLTRNFLKKVRQKRISQLEYLQSFNKLQTQSSWFQIEGINLNEQIHTIFKFLVMLFTFILIFVDSAMLVYQNISEQAIFSIKIMAIIFYSVQLITKMISIKNDEGKIISHLNQIWKNIGYDQLLIDSINILIIVIDISIDGDVMKFLRLILLSKLPQALNNLEEIQIKMITNSQNDKYWSLVKIFLLNFCFAHILAILLSAMAQISPQDNWMTVRNIHNSQWYQKYIWAYYWGTNIMLTVGFGDISASNYKQALCLIFIETISCIILAYNISCVGDLIMNIKQKDCQKKNRIKLFKKIIQSNPVSHQLNWKITKFIEESINLKKNFNYEEQYKFIHNLPKYLKYDFLKETNKSVFNQLPFFQFMMEKTIYNLAQKIEMLMSHPQQIIRNKFDDFNLLILRSGQVGLTYQRPGSDCNDQIIDKIVTKGNQPFILTLNFITKKQLPYQIKSLQYSSFYYMDFQKLIETLKQNIPDFYYYSYLRDKIKNIPDEFQVNKCSLCKDRYHYKFNCPLIHYFPNHDQIIFKYLRDTKISKIQDRTPFERRKIDFKPFEVNRYFKLHKQSKGQSWVDFDNYNNSLLGGKAQYSNVKSVVLEQQASYSNIKTCKILQSADQMKDLKEFISGELEKILQTSQEIDSVWLIRSDCMMDFNSYFRQDNPKNIAVKLNQVNKKRLSRLRMGTKL